MKKWLISVFLLLGCLTVIPSCGKSEKTQVILHPAKTGIATVRYHDESRNRPLITEVWYPIDASLPADPVEGMWVRCAEARDAPIKASSKKYPLVIMSHGNWGDRLNNSWIAETLAANGFIVASMDHYGNTWNNKIPECFIKIWDRPQDITFVIDELLKDERFGPHINKEKIGLVGYSLGGHTAIWVAGGTVTQFDKPDLKSLPADQIPTSVNDDIINSIDFSPARNSYRDARVSAVFVMAPALGYMFDLTSLQNISVPVYIVVADGDKTVPHESSAHILVSKIKEVAITFIPGSASHYVFLNEATKGGKLLLDKRVALDPPTVDRGKIHDEIGSQAVIFFSQHLK